jgi:DNA-binding HxlR family transcriptional regulator
MKKLNKPPDPRICSVGRSMEILGDRWIMFIIREAFFGVTYYDKFLSNLGIATNVLTDRLKWLVENEILEIHADSNDARRKKYVLTEKGRDLFPIILAFIKWGDRWLADESGPPLLLNHTTCGHPLTPVMCCEHCREVVHLNDVTGKEVWRDKDQSR